MIVNLEPAVRSAAVARLMAEATTLHEKNALARVALRAGFLWRCHPCKKNYHLALGWCPCGTLRPTGLV